MIGQTKERSLLIMVSFEFIANSFLVNFSNLKLFNKEHLLNFPSEPFFHMTSPCLAPLDISSMYSLNSFSMNSLEKEFPFL